MLDAFTMVDVLAWLDRRTLANSIELACSHFKQLIETSCLAKRPYHLIQSAELYTNYEGDSWSDCWDEFKQYLSYSCISDRLLCGYHYHVKHEIKSLEFSLFNHNRHTNWLKLRLGKTKKHVGGIDQTGVNAFLKRKKCSPSVVPPIYVRFSETYICVDIFDEMISADCSSASSAIGADEIENDGTAGTNNECSNQKTPTNALMASSSKKGQQNIVNCTKASKWLMALLALMLPNFEGTTMKFHDNSLGLKVPPIPDDILLCVEATNPWCEKNDAQALANVFAHPTWSAMIANSERCICQLPTVMPTKQLSIEGTPHQQNGMLLSGILLKCDRFSYKYSPMFSVEEVVQWLHWPARSSQGRHLQIGIETHSESNDKCWLENLKEKLIQEFHCPSIMSGNINATTIQPNNNKSHKQFTPNPTFTACILSNHLWGVKPSLSRLTVDEATGECLLFAINNKPEAELSATGWPWKEEEGIEDDINSQKFAIFIRF